MVASGVSQALFLRSCFADIVGLGLYAALILSLGRVALAASLRKECQPVKVYDAANLRNLGLIGHGHAGKTTLVSAMLYTAGAAPRLGRVDDGSAITDYDEEEIARKMSIATGLAFVEWGKDANKDPNKVKINLLDTPGFNMFVHEAKMVLPVVDAALVVVDGVAGVEVVTQRVWNY